MGRVPWINHQPWQFTGKSLPSLNNKLPGTVLKTASSSVIGSSSAEKAHRLLPILSGLEGVVAGLGETELGVIGRSLSDVTLFQNS